MSDPLRSADKAYYSARKPLSIQGTREGRKNPVPVPSYRHQGSDVTASSSKYYAVPRPLAPAATPVVRVLVNPAALLDDVIQAFQTGATEVRVQLDAEDIRVARVAVDTAVGRNVLTRTQADAVVFVANPPAPAAEPMVIAPEPDTAVIPQATVSEPEPEVEPEPELSVEPEPELSVEPEALVAEVSALDEADEFLNAPPTKKPAKKKAKKGESKSITEADVAAAFGVSDDSDD